MENELYNLTWNQFEMHTGTTFKDLLMDKNFSDVTLVSDDGDKIQAHKVVLSASSPSLKKILVNSPDSQHVLLFLPGFSHRELSSLVCFMYLGQTKVDHTDLERFIEMGRTLKIKGLSDEPSRSRMQESIIENSRNEEEFQTIVKKDAEEDIISNDSEEVEEADISFFSRRNDSNNYQSELQNSNIDPEIVQTDFKNSFNVLSCDKCDYQAKQSQKLKLHIDAKHNNVKYWCDKCDYSSGYPHHLSTHKKRKHVLKRR